MSDSSDAPTTVPGLGPDGWFREESVMWPGQAMGLKVKEVLSNERTKFQDLSVFENDGPWGTVMTLDGAIQLTDKDEFVYHELMAHIPLCIHHHHQKHHHKKTEQGGKTVLIIGGGDGGVMREVLRHKNVTRCDLVDIDGGVIEASKAYFPQIAISFKDPRAHATVDDGAAFIATKKNEYDVIIVDSSDPEGPASVLFGAEFYTNVRDALKPDGIVCSQGESIWIHKPIIDKMKNFLKNDIKFGSVKYGMIYIPTYPCGSIGALVSSKSDAVDVTKCDAHTLEEALEGGAEAAKKLKYYNSQIHEAAFVLPNFARDINE